MFARLMGLDTVSPQALHALMQTGPVTAIDVNPRQSWMSARVPGALGLDPDRFTAADLPRDKASMLVFYCSNYLCRKAPRAARRAITMGYQRVHVMSAGIKGWTDAGLPVESSAESTDRSSGTARSRQA
jgi:rhodanese-related sulfurtransferase